MAERSEMILRVLDSSSMIAYLKYEPGGESIEKYLKDSESACYAHAVNLCEVHYEFYRIGGEEAARKVIDALLLAGVLFRYDMDRDFWEMAGKLKIDPGKIALGDCFLIALA